MTLPTALPRSLCEALRAVRSVGVITGAGVSKESGIATYRGKGGIYDDPEEGDRTVDSLTGITLLEDPDRTWRTVAQIARQAHQARPNAAHRALARIEEKVPRFALLTQNVDGLHRLAGSHNIIEIHGNVFETRCLVCAVPGVLDAETLAGLEAAPRCARCGGVLRPNAVLFGEMLPEDKVARLREEFYDRPHDLVLTVGTTALFPYIAEPTWRALADGRLTVEVNPERTEISDVVGYRLEGSASVYVPMIENELRG